MTVNASASPTSNRWLVLVIACLAQFMVVLDATVVNVALPSIQRGLHFSASNLAWVVNAYTLIFGGFLMLGGRAADLLGRKRLFAAGVALFSLASLLNGLAQSSAMLIVGRGLQGLGGALLSPAALSIINTTFTETSERTKALGVWSAIAAGGGAVGLLLGGVLTDLASWPWIFIVNVPVGAATLALTLRYVPESRAHMEHRTFDLAGAFTVTAGLVVLVYSIVKSQTWGWGSPRTIGLLAGGVALLALFVAIESRSKAPLMRLSMFRVRTLERRRRRAPARRLRDVRDVLLRLAVRAGDPRLQPAARRAGLPARHRRHRRRRRHRPAADPPGRCAQRGRGRDHARRGRDGRAHAGAGARQLRRRPAPRPAADEHRHGTDVRAGHPARDRRRERGRRRTGLRVVQHRPAGRRLARAGDPRHARREPDEQPAPRRPSARWRPGSPATTSHSPRRRSCSRPER